MGCDGQESGPARNPGGGDRLGPVSREKAQKRHRLGVELAANDEAAPPRACELRVGLMSLTARCSSESAAGLDIGAWVGVAEPRQGRRDRGVECKLGPMPQEEVVRDNLGAPCIGYRHIDVHFFVVFFLFLCLPRKVRVRRDQGQGRSHGARVSPNAHRRRPPAPARVPPRAAAPAKRRRRRAGQRRPRARTSARPRQ